MAILFTTKLCKKVLEDIAKASSIRWLGLKSPDEWYPSAHELEVGGRDLLVYLCNDGLIGLAFDKAGEYDTKVSNDEFVQYCARLMPKEGVK